MTLAMSSEFAPSPEAVELRLFVAGRNGVSETAQRHLDEVLQTAEPGRYRLEIVDVLTDPAAALAENILVTPTLICIRNRVRSIMVGDLGSLDRLRAFIAR